MNRRQFTKVSGALGATALLANSGIAMPAPPKYNMGYQLFSIRDDMAEKPLETLKALKALGYEDFEMYGFDEKKGLIYGFTPKELKTILNDLNLTITSGHYGFSPYLGKSEEEVKRFVDQCIECALTLNSKYITWPWIAPEQRTIENFKMMVPMLNKIGEQVMASGLGFAYHNHGFEFEDQNGENGFDIIVNGTDPSLVKLQMDMYWVMHAGKTTPKKLIEEQPGRYVMWHIKDMDKETRDYSELGNGSIDYLDIIPDPGKSGLEYFYIEQGGNFAVSSLQSATDSANYFKKNLRDKI